MKKTLLSLSLIALALAGKAQDCSDLFISEYVEGSGNNKAMEFYNPTTVTKNMNNYRLVRYSNGSTTGSDSTDLVGSINAFSTFVIANGTGVTSGTTATSPACDPALQAKAQQIDHAYPNPTAMNGNDAMVLVRKSPYAILDIFGRIGEDPGTAWSDATGKWWTSDHSLQRKASVKLGITSNPLQFQVQVQWDSLPKNNWSKVGLHTCNCFVALSTSVSAVSPSLCITYTAPITATTSGGNGPVSFTWSPASHIQGSTNGASIIAAPSTASSIIYTVVASDGFSSTTNTVVIQGVACSPLTTSLSSSSTTVCLTQTIGILATTNGGSNNYTYSWQPASQIFGSSTSASIVAKPTSTATPVIYTLTVNDGGAMVTNTFSIQANDCGLAFTPMISAASSTVCTNEFLTISAESTYGGSGSYTYTWSPASEIQGATNTASISAHPSTSSTTSIVYSVIVSDGVAAPVTMTMVINPSICDVSVKENVNEVYLKMFPNPNNGNEISFVSDKNIKEINIFNNIGQIVMSHNVMSNEKSVIVNNLNLSKGIYSVIIRNEEGFKSEKLIIQ